MPLAASSECRREKVQKPLDLLQRTLLPSQEPQPLSALPSLLSPESCFLHPCAEAESKKGKKEKKKKSAVKASTSSNISEAWRGRVPSIQARHLALLLAGGTFKTVCSRLLTLILASPFCLIKMFRAASSWACHSSLQLQGSQGLHSSPGPAARRCISLERPLRKYWPEPYSWLIVLGTETKTCYKCIPSRAEPTLPWGGLRRSDSCCLSLTPTWQRQGHRWQTAQCHGGTSPAGCQAGQAPQTQWAPFSEKVGANSSVLGWHVASQGMDGSSSGTQGISWEQDNTFSCPHSRARDRQGAPWWPSRDCPPPMKGQLRYGWD